MVGNAVVDKKMKENQIRLGNPGPSAEDRILNAAKRVFMEKGFDGARMQEIADKACINKALLYYYFRSKDKLFVAVFESAISRLLPSLEQIFIRKGLLTDKIKDFFDIHMGFLLENPMIPRFIVTELSLKPDRLMDFFLQIKKLDIYSKFNKLINNSIEAGEIRPIAPEQLLLNLISLSVFPVLAGPMIKGILNIGDDEYENILRKRKVLAAEFVIQALTCSKIRTQME